jgi:hypothetical protein
MKETAKIFGVYLLVLFCLFLCGTCRAQVSEDGIQVVQFNAEWNSANAVDWLTNLSDCSISELDISAPNIQSKYKIAVVPTIVIFDEGEEIDRFQADLSFKLVATKKDVQSIIDEILMSKF